MYRIGDDAFRTLRTSAAIILCALSVSCEREPSAPNDIATGLQPRQLRVARARVIEPGDLVIPNPPAVDAWSWAGVADPINLAFDTKGHRLLSFESTSQLIEMMTGPDGRVRQTLNRIDARGLGVRDPQGLTIDAASGRVFVLDAGQRIVRLDPNPILGLRSAITAVIDLEPAGLSHLRGIAFDPTTGHLHVLDRGAQALYEVSQAGQIVASRDVSEFRLSDVRAMTFAPTGDATDDVSAMGLYIAAGRRMMELSVDAPITPAATLVTGTLVKTTLTSEFSPKSPDPSGLTYASHLGNLVMVDGEVDEMSIYAGANAFEMTLGGALSRSWATTSFSFEPVGAAYNPGNRVLFVSDDNARDVFKVEPGADGRYGTADDRVTSFDTVIFGCNDPEGLAYDVANGVLFIADGVNAEVYRVSPGANGVFDGVPPAGDDQVTNFDTNVHGLTDPEGIAYDSDFGHLYVGGKPKDRVFHLTTSGTLIRTIDISAAPVVGNAAGLEYAPPSSGSGPKTLYIVDRGVDNDSDPNENDGKMFELSVPALSGNVLPTVTITAPPTGSAFSQGNAITFTGTASDVEDGNLTGSIAWTSSLDGAFGSGGSISTSTLSLGTHTITAAVTDAGGGRGSAAITVTVDPVGVRTVQVRVSAGADDVEESATGTLSLTSSDLELVNDGASAGNQTVGLRFRNVAIPSGATITGAYVQFQVDEATTAATSLTVRGEAADNAAAFSSTAKPSARNRTVSAVAWSPVGWPTVGHAGVNQQTPSLKAVMQEIVNRPGWSSGNALAVIITGTGKRTAEAFEDLPAGAPLLSVSYTVGSNTAPTATSVTISGIAQVGRILTGNYTYSDADGDAEGSSTYRWLRDGAPITGATSRSYALVAADEGALIRFEVTPVAAAGTTPGASVQSGDVGPIAAASPNAAPTASNVAITGTAEVGKVLTGNYTYNDADADPEGASMYRWLRNGAAISGAEARTYTLVAADQGAMIAFEVTPAAATGLTPGVPVQSEGVGPVAAANTPPVATNVTITGTAQVGQVLTGSYTYSDAEGDAEGTSTYRWLRAGAPITGATARTYTLVAADQGAMIRFEVRPFAVTGASPGTAVQSLAVGPVAGATSGGVVQVRIAAGADDAEESATGSLALTSSDLELVNDGTTGDQTVGLRFTGVAIPQGATITRAYVQFQVDEATTAPTSLTIRGQAADNAAAFSFAAKISPRTRTVSAVAWSPVGWPTANVAGVDQQTPSLTSVIQEIVNRPGWASGNALAIIINGTGKRTAEAFEGVPAAAPLLRVEYTP